MQVPLLLAPKPLDLDHASMPAPMPPRRREPFNTRAQPDSLLLLKTRAPHMVPDMDVIGRIVPMATWDLWHCFLRSV